MAQHYEVLTATSATDLESAFDAAWATRLTQRILGCDFVVRDTGRFTSRQYLLAVTWDDAGSTMSAPYTLDVVEADSPANLQAAVNAVLAASPSSFFSEAIYSGTEPGVIRVTDLAVLVTSTDATDGALNWRVTGQTSGSVAPGPAGGDLTGSYPDPQVLQVTGSQQAMLSVGVNSVATISAAAVGAVVWEVVLARGGVRAAYTVAMADGATAVVTQQVATAGTIDVTLTSVSSGGNLILRATAATAGWAIGWRRTSLAVA